MKAFAPIKPKIGRPLKYKYIILLLDPQAIYSAASIAAFARNNGLLGGYTKATLSKKYTRVRITLGRLSRDHGFPKYGDGLVQAPGQPSFPGWCGWRWQKAVGITKEEP